MEIKKEYYKNGNLKSEILLNNKKIPHGKSKFFHINGSLKREVQYENGVEADGAIRTFDPYGNLSRKAILRDGELDGPYEEYWTNGNLKSSLEYEKGRLIKVNRRCDYFGDDVPIAPHKLTVDRIHLIDVRNKLDYTVSSDIDLLEGLNESIDSSWTLNPVFSDVRCEKEFSTYDKAKRFFEDFVKTYDFEITDIDLENKRQWGSKDGFDIAQQNTKIQIINSNIFDKHLVLDMDFHQSEEECVEFVSLNWIQGIGIVYNRKELDEKQINIPKFIPIYFNSDSEYVMIECYSNQIAEYYIDRVILENGGFNVYIKEDDQDQATYIHNGPLFSIYILNQTVVIKRFKPRLVSVDGSEKLRGISKYSNLINKDIKGLKSLIYCSGDLGTPDGRFCITDNNSMINSWWNDDEKAVIKFKEIVKGINENHPVLTYSNKDLIKKTKSSDFLANMSLLDVHISNQYMIGLAMGDNFMHITITLNKINPEYKDNETVTKILNKFENEKSVLNKQKKNDVESSEDINKQIDELGDKFLNNEIDINELHQKMIKLNEKKLIKNHHENKVKSKPKKNSSTIYEKDSKRENIKDKSDQYRKFTAAISENEMNSRRVFLRDTILKGIYLILVSVLVYVLYLFYKEYRRGNNIRRNSDRNGTTKRGHIR